MARLKGVWSAGECVEEHELDRLGYYTHVKNDGRSTNCVRIVNGVETVSTRLRDIRISDGVGNSEMLKSFVLDSAKQVVSVVVGDGCFTNGHQGLALRAAAAHQRQDRLRLLHALRTAVTSCPPRPSPAPTACACTPRWWCATAPG